MSNPPPPGGGWGQPYQAPPPPPAQNHMAMVAMILGILSVSLGLCLAAFCYVGNLILAIPAIVLGFIGLNTSKQTPDQVGRAQALTGIITGFVSVGLTILFIILIVVLGVSGFFDSGYDY